MSKKLQITTIIIGVLLMIYVILGGTGMLKMYNFPTSANEPGIKVNSKIFISNLVDYNNGDFVCYKYNDEMLGEHFRVHRLLGKSNDVVEIKNQQEQIDELNKVIQDIENKRETRDTNADKIRILNPSIKPKFEIRHQEEKRDIFHGIIAEGERIDFTMCNPPFHASIKEYELISRSPRTKREYTLTQNHDIWSTQLFVVLNKAKP